MFSIDIFEFYYFLVSVVKETQKFGFLIRVEVQTLVVLIADQH